MKRRVVRSREEWLGQERGGLVKRRVVRSREDWLGEEKGG